MLTLAIDKYALNSRSTSNVGHLPNPQSALQRTPPSPSPLSAKPLPGKDRLYANRPLPEAPPSRSNPPSLSKLATTEVQQSQLPHTPVTTPSPAAQESGKFFERSQLPTQPLVRSPPCTPKENSSFEAAETKFLNSKGSEISEHKHKRKNTLRLRELTLAQLENSSQSPVENTIQEGAGDPEDDSFTFRLDEDFSVLSFARELGLPTKKNDTTQTTFHYHHNNHSTPHDSSSPYNEATFNSDVSYSSTASHSLPVGQSSQEQSVNSSETSKQISDVDAIGTRPQQKESNVQQPLHPRDKPSEAWPQAKAPHSGPVSPLENRPRHICRGCTKPIVGKSVASSDGQLTGRWHKECFKCTKCSQSFPTGNFYVYANAPYCSYHYHETNGSLCRACDRGIEGQYLESDCRPAGVGKDVEIKKSAKYHAECFKCHVCKKSLNDDYFAWNGFAYCEHHAETVVVQYPLLFGPPANMPANAFVSPRPAPPPPSPSSNQQRAPAFRPPPSPRLGSANDNLNPNLSPDVPKKPTSTQLPPSPSFGFSHPSQHVSSRPGFINPPASPSSPGGYHSQRGFVPQPPYAKTPVNQGPGPNGRPYQHHHRPAPPPPGSPYHAATLPSHGPHGSGRPPCPRLNLGVGMPTYTGGPDVAINPMYGNGIEHPKMPERRTTVLLAQ